MDVSRRYAEDVLYCLKYKAYRSIMPPEEKNIVKFEKYEYQQQIPYAIHAHLEVILHPNIKESTPTQSPLSQFPFIMKKEAAP